MEDIVALNIKDPETDRLARELASLTGESITDATRRAPEERLQAVRRRTPQRDLRGIIRRGRARPMLDARHADEILGYGGDRLPA